MRLTVLGWLALLLAAWWILETPGGAAHVVHDIGLFLNRTAAWLTIHLEQI